MCDDLKESFMEKQYHLEAVLKNEYRSFDFEKKLGLKS